MKSLDDARDEIRKLKKATQKCCFFLKFDVKYMGQYMGQLCYVIIKIWLICPINGLKLHIFLNVFDVQVPPPAPYLF